MTYPPPGGTPDPYQPQQPYSQDPYASPASGQPYASPASGQPYQQFGDAGKGQPYGQQAYGQQPYSGAPYGGQPYGQSYTPVAPTNTMAILALVFAFIFPPAAIIMGHVAKKQIRQTGEQGDGLATAGLWLGYIFTGLYVVFCAFWLIIAGAGLWGANASGY